MTVYVETDFLLALAKDTDWLQESAEAALDEHEVETSAFSYLLNGSISELACRCADSPERVVCDRNEFDSILVGDDVVLLSVLLSHLLGNVEPSLLIRLC